MKNFFALFWLTVVLFSFFGCGERQSDAEPSSVTPIVEKINNQTLRSGAATVSSTKESTSNKQYSFTAKIEIGKNDVKANTYTGYAALPSVTFEVSDSQNQAGYSETAVNHSFGVSKGGKPHEISVASQAFFDEKGYNAVTYDNKSNDKVLYLTFDCGYENGYTSVVLDTLKEKQVPAAFFCTLDHIKSEPELIARMIREGHIIGNHSDKHPNFSKISRTEMVKEIENCDNYLREHFGYSAPYFRFPEGVYTESALDEIGSLGYRCVFWSLSYADWDTSRQRGKNYAFQTVTQRLHPGAVILLHAVSPDNAQALGDIIDEARRQGYEFRNLTQLP